MNVVCPECRTVYRVDPAKVPVRGVRARCVRCPGEFQVEREDAASSVPGSASLAASGILDAVAASPAAEMPFASSADGLEAAGVAAWTGDQDEGGASAVGEDPTETSAMAATDVGVPAMQPSPEPLPVEGDEPPLPPPPFGSADPRVRARRLARALVSDIVVYNSERRARSLQNGTLRQEFRDEIRKSWEEYVSQVGNEIARETSYFQEALNEILAGGARQF